MIAFTQLVLIVLVVGHAIDYMFVHRFNPIYFVIFLILLVINSYLYDKDKYNNAALDYLNKINK